MPSRSETSKIKQMLLGNNAIRFQNPSMQREFNKFLSQLRLISDDNVILSYPDYSYIHSIDTLFVSQDNWHEKLKKQDQRKLLIFSIFCRPLDYSKIWPLGFPFLDAYIHMLPVPKNITASPRERLAYGMNVLPGCLSLLTEPGFELLLKLVPFRKSIKTLSFEYIGPVPELYWCDSFQIAEWSQDWAIIYKTYDNDDMYLLPFMLGFIRKNRLERNFVNLLREGTQQYGECYYSVPGKSIDEDWPLATIALEEGEDGLGNWDLVSQLLEIDDISLESLFAEEPDRDKFINRVNNIFNDYCCLDSDTKLKDLIMKVGKPSLRAIEKKLAEWEIEYEAQEKILSKKREEMEKLRREKLKPFDDIITIWLHIICGPAGYGPCAGMSPGNKCWSLYNRYLGDYVIRNGEMPSGIHIVNEREINFDIVASQAKLAIENKMTPSEIYKLKMY